VPFAVPVGDVELYRQFPLLHFAQMNEHFSERRAAIESENVLLILHAAVCCSQNDCALIF
jgi:hypothetical protein